jgi:hypothetical protein
MVIQNLAYHEVLDLCWLPKWFWTEGHSGFLPKHFVYQKPEACLEFVAFVASFAPLSASEMWLCNEQQRNAQITLLLQN